MFGMFETREEFRAFLKGLVVGVIATVVLIEIDILSLLKW